jgi:membrane protease YdiL (CAAX protease family)
MTEAEPVALTRAPGVRTRALLLLEAILPFLAAQTYIWCVPPDRSRAWDATFGVVLIVVVAGYVLRRGLLSREILGVPAAWRVHGMALLWIGGFTIVTVAGLLSWGWAAGELRQDWDVLFALLAYPVWGVLQQGAVFIVAYPRFKRAGGVAAAVVGSAALFGLAHFPNPFLMLGGFGMALMFALVWRRYPSLLAVALGHGVIGAVCDKALHVNMRMGPRFFEG